MSGVELAVGYLAAWAWRRGQHVGQRAGGEADAALDALLDQLHTLVSSKLGMDPSVRQLEHEAGASSGGPEVSVRPRTSQRVRLTLEDAIEADPVFGRNLAQVVQRLQRVDQHSGPSVAAAFVAIGARGPAVGRDLSGIGYVDQHGKAAGRDIHDHSRTTYRRGVGIVGLVLVLLLVGAAAFHYVPQVLYKRKVLATCNHVQSILSASTSDDLDIKMPTTEKGFFQMWEGGSAPVVLDKATMLATLKNQDVDVQSEFAQLADQTVPKDLSAKKKAVDAAVGSWLHERNSEIRWIEKYFHPQMTEAQISKLPTFTIDVSKATTLNSKLTDLASAHCEAIPIS